MILALATVPETSETQNNNKNGKYRFNDSVSGHVSLKT